MIIGEITIAEELDELIRECADDRYCLELLRFFGEYPRARFSELAVVHALNSNPGKKRLTRRALSQLADKGAIRVSTENNISFYSLTEDELLRRLASYLSKLDWYQWQRLLKQIYPTLG